MKRFRLWLPVLVLGMCGCSLFAPNAPGRIVACDAIVGGLGGLAVVLHIPPELVTAWGMDACLNAVKRGATPVEAEQAAIDNVKAQAARLAKAGAKFEGTK